MPRSYFVCTYENCSATFRHSEKYNSHLRLHAGERPFICVYDDCDKSYTRLSHLKRHEKTHESMHRCEYPKCNKILISNDTLQKHIDIVHLKKKHKTYKCTFCDQEFNKHNWLTSHMYSHTGIKPYECPEPDCDRRFLRPSKLKQHMKYHKGYPCDKPNCSETFSKWSLLTKHIKECHPLSHKCPSCDKVFSTTSNLKQHSLVHQEEREIFRCPVPKCIRFYQAKRHLAEHLKHFHEERSYSCPKEDCYTFCKTEEELVKHITRRHSPRTRKSVHPKPTFAEILAGFAKGTRKDLNPHLSNVSKSDETNKDLSESANVNIEDTITANNGMFDLTSAKELNPYPSITSKSNETHEQLVEFSDLGDKERSSIFEDSEHSISTDINENSNQNYTKDSSLHLLNTSNSGETCEELSETSNIKDNEKTNITNKDEESSVKADSINEVSSQEHISSTKDAWNSNNLHVKKFMCNVLA